MKKHIHIWILSAAASLILTTGLLAQEQVEVSVRVEKDGKVVKDTTYMFDDVDEAEHAMKMMDVMTGDDEHMEHVTYNYTSAHAGSGETKTMVFISEDGEQTEITEFSGDSNVWVSKEEGDGEHVKVIKYKIDEDGDSHGKKVIVMSSEDGSSFDILVDEDDEGHVVKKKEIKVIVSGDEEGNWTVEEGDGENVKVIVITEGDDLHEHHDEDCDHDEDVEVKVVKKKVKKEK